MRAEITPILQALPKESLDPTPLAHLEDHKDETWFLACSGGADSVCLVHLIARLYPKKSGSLHVVHFNHGLRGEESETDAVFVQGLANEYALPLHIGKGENLAGANEATLREARMGYIHRVMELHKANILLQGHHLDDVGETLLMRLCRGTTLSGLAAPRPVQPFYLSEVTHVRPFLTIRREAIRNALDLANFPWREDASNHTGQYFRNRIRNQILPQLVEVSPNDPALAMAKTRQILEEDDEALHQWADEAFQKLHGHFPDTLSWPESLPTAVVRRVLYRWLPGGSISSHTMEPIIHAILNRYSLDIQITQERYILVDPDNGELKLRHTAHHKAPSRWPTVHLAPSAMLYLPEGNSIGWEYLPVTDKVQEDLDNGNIDTNRTCWLDPDKLTSKPTYLKIRHRQPGDMFQPLGMAEPAKLQHILVNKKIPAGVRDQLPVILSPDEQILWYPGCPAPELQKIGTPPTKAIRITYHPRKAWV